jgi:hypothetical protein
MKYRHVMAATILFVSFAATAQSGWIDMQGNSLPETGSAKSKGGFSASLVVTPDKDWQEKWDTPPDVVPHFTEAREVSDGGELYILTFLSNPKLDPTGMTDVACDFVVTRPDGSKSVNEMDVPCFKVALATDPKQVYLSGTWLKVIAEPADLRGAWEVGVTVKDRIRGVEIPLETTFQLK